MEHSDTKAAPQQGAMRYVLLTPAEIAFFLARHKNQATSGALLIFALASLLIITGCTGDSSLPNPSDGPPPSSSSPTVVATTESAPETTAAPIYKPATDQGPAENVPMPLLPQKAKELSKEGLIAFTDYWYQTLGYAFETGDPGPMMKVTGPNCATCERIRTAVGPWHAEGRWIVGGKMAILSVNTLFIPLQNDYYEVTALVRQEQLKFYRGDGSLAEDRGQKSSVGDVITASHIDGQWIALDVQRLG